MRKWRIVGFVLLVVMCFALLTVGAGARGVVETDRTASLSLTYSYGGKAFAGLEIRIYRVASITSNTVFVPTEEFESYPLSLNTVKSQSEWNQIAETTAAYVMADQIEATSEATTDENGKANYTDLSTGLYLVEACRVDYENGYCLFDSFMIVLPGLDVNDDWVYDVDANPKSVYEEVDEDTVDYNVIKLWKDAGFEIMRPQNVEIALYKNGVYVESVILSAENDWSYTWSAPGDGAVWTAVEPEVKNGYTVTLEQKGNTFVVVNTYKETPPPPTGDAAMGNIAIIVAAIAGLGFIVLGVARRRRV